VTTTDRPTALFFYACLIAVLLPVLGPVIVDGNPLYAQNQTFSTAIEPDKYVVGPGDGFRVDFWDGSVQTMSLTVTAEGNVLLQSMGLVDVAGLTLTEAKGRLGELIRKFYADLDFSISLTGVRQVNIMLTGGVAKPGLYTAGASSRVSELIAQAGGLIRGASRRNICLSGCKKECFIDLLKFERVGDFDSNPYIYSGNKIHVPVVTDSTTFVQISGEVVLPGGYEYKEDDNLGGLIELALGFTGLHGDSIYIFDGGGLTGSRVVAIDDLYSRIEPGDKIVVSRIEKDLANNFFSITGEIRVPGKYPYQKGLTFDDALSVCGGASPRADLYSSVIYRRPEHDRSDESKKFLNASVDNNLSFESGREPVSIDFREYYPDHLDRVGISPGDSLVIPANTGLVGVYGMVKRPGMVMFDEIGSAASYIRKAGGYSGGADKGRVQVIRKSSEMRLTGDPGIDVYDGDTIIIPEDKNRKSFWSKVKDISMIVGGLGILYLAVDNASD